jgi:hypothetical protein
MYTLNDWVQGELAEAGDLNGLNDAIFAFSGYFIPILFGTENFNGAGSAALAPTVTGTMQVGIGGAGQLAVFEGNICDVIPATNIAIPYNDESSGDPRWDLIVATYVQNQVNPFTRGVRAEDGTVTATTCYEVQQSVTFTWVQGTPGAYGTIPAGAVAVCRVEVPPAGAAITDGDITMLLSSFASVIGNIAVASMNGLFGSVDLVSSDGSIVVTPDTENNTIDLQAGAAAASLTSLNGVQGVATLNSDGSISVTQSGETITIKNNGVRSLSSPDGSITIGGTAGVLTLMGMLTYNGNGSAEGWGSEGHCAVLVGDQNTDSEGYITVYPPAGYVMLGGTATFRDATYANAIEIAVQSATEESIVFSGRYSFTNPPTPAPAGLGINFVCFARPS